MNSLLIKRNTFVIFMFIFQVAALFIYLFANIIDIGEVGVALPVLSLYMVLSCLVLLILSLGQRIFFKMHFFVFMIYILWISLRVIVDLNDVTYIREIIFATTGGVLLFYIIGATLGASIFNIIESNQKNIIPQILLLSFTCTVTFLFYNYSQNTLDLSVFLIADAQDYYQRPGNFMSISFIVISFIFFYHTLGFYEKNINRKDFFFWLIFYIVSTSLLLVCTQMIGSNSATVVVTGCFLITFVISLVCINNDFIINYKYDKVSLLKSKQLFKNLIIFAFLGLSIFIIILLTVISITDFDIDSLRLLGFGSGNISLSSRLNILSTAGLDQLSYAPIFGNMNVAFLTTRDSGLTLHSFLPYVMANLGLIGFIIVFFLFYMIFKQFINGTKRGTDKYKMNMINLFSFFMLLFVFLFANISTGIEWAVLNFSIGFFSRPIYFKANK